MIGHTKLARSAAIILTASLCLAGTALAAADENSAYEPQGANLGGFTLFPTLKLETSFDDNVYASTANEMDDVSFALRPELVLRSNWSRHALRLTAGGQGVWFAEMSDENHTDAWVALDAEMDISYVTSIVVHAGYSMLTEDRTDPNAFGLAAEPTSYDVAEASIELRQSFNNIGFAVGGGVETLDFDDVPAIGGGTLDSDFRDRTVLTAMAEANFAVNPDTRAFVRGTFNDREYDQQPPLVLLTRDSQGYEVVGGLRFDVSRLISGEVFAGYLEQDYVARPDIDGATYGVDLDWDVTPLTTLSFGASRGVKESVSAGTAGFLHTEAEFGIEHELLRNLNLSGDVSFAVNDYEGIAREDDIWSAGIGLQYFVSRNLAATAGYTFVSRDSNAPAVSFDQTRVRGGLAWQY